MSSIHKIEISTGVYWIEIPDADLRLLCGAPADSVKHLMKKGLIVPIEKNGLRYETGPNAILLSDVMIQNGAFCNLAEFPVIQMLYRQGMILPDHPNNTGQKPLIIGSEEQVASQLEYIYRGNYGLISKEEITEAGIAPEFADELMRMKLRFAFGKIKNSDDLIDSLIIGNDPVEIKNGVWIERLLPNLFKITHGESSCQFDLNLPRNHAYAVPYSLGYHRFDRGYFSIIHSGEGDGWDIDRPCSSSILCFQGKIYLIDAGPNLSYLLTSLGIGVNEIDGIFHTHGHDDHFSGLTTLLRTDHKIKYFATPLVRHSVTKKLCALLDIEEEEFANYFDIHDLTFDTWNKVGALEVMPAFSPHPVETNVFHFRTMSESGYKTYAHLVDITSFEVLQKMLEDEKHPGISEHLHNQTINHYLRPADVKKLDIGGGMIHGHAEDFREDVSKKIILTHTSLPLSSEQKLIGSGAPFGTVDVLIPSYQNYHRERAFQFLKDYFQHVDSEHLQSLLNNPITEFNPETLILKEGAQASSLHMIITGEVEVINPTTGHHAILNSGSLIDEYAILFDEAPQSAYRAKSFTQTLEIPVSHFRHFIEHFQLREQLEKMVRTRSFLSSTWLFGESISHIVQNRIAKAAKEITIVSGDIQKHSIDPDSLLLIRSGRIQRSITDTVLEELKSGDFFREEKVLFQYPELIRSKVVEEARLYQIPAGILKEIPVVHWKAFELYEKRHVSILTTTLKHNTYMQWESGLQCHVQRIDKLHQQLIDIINILYYIQISKTCHEDVVQAYDALITTLRHHFECEEKLLAMYGYPELEVHRLHHRSFLVQIEETRNDLNKLNDDKLLEILILTSRWLDHHFRHEDQTSGRYLNQIGVY